jgi:hypothetical protein
LSDVGTRRFGLSGLTKEIDMAKALTTSCFDGISKELKSKLIYREGRVKKHLASAKRSLFDLAEEFAGARDDCKAEDENGTFITWADETFGMSKSSAYRIASVFDRIVFPYVGNDSTLNFIGFDDYALYDLAQTTTPEKAIKDAIKIAKKGGRLTHKQAKELIALHTVVVEPEDNEEEPEADDDNTVDAESVTPTSEPCPNCGCTEWTEDDSGSACSACSHPQGEPVGDADEPEPPKSQASIVLDELERVVIDSLREQHGLNAVLKTLGNSLDKARREVKELATVKGGEWLELVHIDTLLRDAKRSIQQAGMLCECPKCKGKVKSDCKRCEGHGFIPIRSRGVLSDAEKGWLGI